MGNRKRHITNLPLSSVPIADDGIVMSVPIQTHIRKRKCPPKFPLYDERDLNLILRFLAAYLTEFQMALESEKKMAGIAAESKLFANRVLFRRYQVATVKALINRAFWPQKHLALVTDDEIRERVKTCLQT